MQSTKSASFAARAAAGGRALASLSTVLGRVLARLDAHLLRLLDAPLPPAPSERAGLLLEASLLLRLRRGLAPSLRDPTKALQERIDNVVADGLLQAAEAAQGVLVQLEAEGLPRLNCWLAHCRELVSELGALGAGLSGQQGSGTAAEKERAERLASAVARAQGPTPALAHDLGQFYLHLVRRLEEVCPTQNPRLLDALLRAAPLSAVLGEQVGS